MAEKRPLGTLGPVMYGKLPRLEADAGTGHSLPPSAVGNPDACSYKGTCFSCPVAGPPKTGSERLSSWTSYPPLYPSSVAGPPLRADNLLTSCLLYRPPADGSEKMQEPGPAELLPFGPQAPSYPGPPLAAPKPVYRNPLCYGLPACLGDGTAKRPLDVDWTLVTGPLLPTADPPCPLVPTSSKGQPLDGTFLRGVPAVGGSVKDTSVGFSPCQAFLDKYRTVPSPGFLAPKYTGPYSEDPKQAIAEGSSSSPWTQLAPPLGPPCQDAAPAHYALPHAPQTLPCPPACRHPEKPASYSSMLPVPPLGAHKGAGYQSGGLGSPYLRQQAAQTPYLPPVGLDTYSYSSAPLTAPSPGLKLEPPLAPRCPLDFAPQTLGFPYARDDLSLYGASPGLAGTPPSQSSVQAVPQPSTLQRPCQPLPASQPPCPEPPRPAEQSEEKTWLPSCRKERHPGTPIGIRDSPAPRTSPALPPCARDRPAAPPKEEGSGPSSSPPMPIIDNVFSLAPYREYLDVQTPEATTEPETTPAPKDNCDKDGGGDSGTLPAQEVPPETSSVREEVALDLSVKKSAAEATSLRVPSPAVHKEPTASTDGPKVGDAASNGPDLKKAAIETAGTTEDTPRTNFHSSVAFMFHKFKILRPAPLPGAVVPVPPPPAPPPPPSSVPAPAPSSVPIGLQILTQPLPVACFNLTLPSPPITVASPASANMPAPAPGSTPGPAPALAPTATPPSTDSLEPHFMGLHTSLCDTISATVAHSLPEKLQEWLACAGPWGKAAWRDFQGVQGLLGKVQAQLQRFERSQKCPFPHVVRAGAIFVPIHLVKERLFPRLPPSSVDHALQEHRVELRPTTLSEERTLRERALHGCPSRLLKLLALRQLPDIYPDLLGLQWRDCVRRQLGEHGTAPAAAGATEAPVARVEPESLALAQKSAAPKVRKPGRKLPTPGPERPESARRGACSSSPPPCSSASPPSPSLKTRFRSLLETAWFNGLALPTWGHKALAPDRSSAQPRLLDGQSPPL
ncbi:uncharacterized protein C15orf39 homolog isoform X2 [Ochotona curzoniae]|uniref:uncharacterized protein C15orf39 homolog isoform X2 n=1 Tax=Ochotona curzoniae TaxID=130825 RepID=UPI001B347384|nr:uncharacterized protein C15orf39 homolog isoform X2 [Ochotona curzoniae]